MHATPLARERQRGRQTADAAAGDEYGQVGFGHGSPPFVPAIIIASRARPQCAPPPRPPMPFSPVQFLDEPARRTPVMAEAEVVVLGGGPAGIAAAACA